MLYQVIEPGQSLKIERGEIARQLIQFISLLSGQVITELQVFHCLLATEVWLDFTTTIITAATLVLFHNSQTRCRHTAITRRCLITSGVSRGVPLQQIGTEGLVLPFHVEAVIISTNSPQNFERPFPLHEQLV
ncbi:hypothetical protein PoB_006660600 [Plakobranchus ocellatus]|uniref:Uncharacterized protein n=1 Tax=Plakobranchus ocellatus TaxID=259542 RepID=A0AAV4D7T3_9GAST|nr:hypothetical protein PoB_006660600 [Plakobranchus ocellatus]